MAKQSDLIVLSCAEAEQHLDAFLADAGFAGYCFSTSFAIRFERMASNPVSMTLHLDCDWWFGDREEWLSSVAARGPVDVPDPDEAVQAFELTRLRWQSTSSVQVVRLSPGKLELEFSAGMILTATTSGGECWELFETGRGRGDSQWAFVQTEDQFLLRRPATEG